MSRTSSRFRAVSAIAAALALTLVALFTSVSSGNAQDSRSFAWNRYDVTIEVEQSGSLLITEQFGVTFSGTPAFTYGFADIPTNRTEGIDVVRFGERTDGGIEQYEAVAPSAYDRSPGTYTVSQDDATVFIEYGIEPAIDEMRSFELTFRAYGALRVDGEGFGRTEQVWWNAISTEVTDLAPIEHASITIVLPTAVSLDTVVLGEDTPGPASLRTEDGITWRWDATELGVGEDFVARMQWPAITTAAVPSWQTADDCEQRSWSERVIDAAIAELAALLGISISVPCNDA